MLALIFLDKFAQNELENISILWIKFGKNNGFSSQNRV
jgi:hypothetical protein